MAQPSTQATESGPSSLRREPDSANELSTAAGPLDRFERELLADPCDFVRRACQIADYPMADDVGASEEALGNVTAQPSPVHPSPVHPS